MKRIVAAVFAFALLFCLAGCGVRHGGAPENDPPAEPYWADGQLTQAEVRGHYDILFQPEGEEGFIDYVDLITLDDQLTMVLRPDRSDSKMLSFDSYDPETGAAAMEQSEETEDGTYTLFCNIVFSEKNDKLTFEGTYKVELDGVVKENYAISGTKI